MSDNYWEPFRIKLKFWIDFVNNFPNIPRRGNELIFDEYRRDHDLDCRLAGGDLKADTIFSLWLPLRYTLISLHGLPWLQEHFGKVEKSTKFLQSMLNYGLEELLPEDKLVVQQLRNLYILGQGRENVMILINRGLNPMRGGPPYHDYVPYFLKECFEGGAFFHFFNKNPEVLRNWLMREELQFFFEDGYLTPEALYDLSGTGAITVGHPFVRIEGNLEGEEAQEATAQMIFRYVEILKMRRQVMFG